MQLVTFSSAWAAWRTIVIARQFSCSVQLYVCFNGPLSFITNSLTLDVRGLGTKRDKGLGILNEIWLYEGVSKSFRTYFLERELQMVHLSATRCSCIAILWVILVSFAAIALCVASQQVFVIVDFVKRLSPETLDTRSYDDTAWPICQFSCRCWVGFWILPTLCFSTWARPQGVFMFSTYFSDFVPIFDISLNYCNS
jgi:hypothetical protein